MLHECTTRQDFQSAFATRLRNPISAELPEGVPSRRMRAYEELVFNNLMGFLNPCFPVAKSIIGEARWQQMGRRFFIEHQCQSPLFRDIPGEFLGWLQSNAGELVAAYPFLTELMHYEWLELAVEIAPDAPLDQINPSGDLLNQEPVWNPAARTSCYSYPVHCIGPDLQPAEPDPTPSCFLLVRQPQGRIEFTQLTPISARLAEWLEQGGRTGVEVLEGLAAELGLAVDQGWLEAGTAQLEGFRASGAVLGTSLINRSTS